jgi:hypothetical protein
MRVRKIGKQLIAELMLDKTMLQDFSGPGKPTDNAFVV